MIKALAEKAAWFTRWSAIRSCILCATLVMLSAVLTPSSPSASVISKRFSAWTVDCKYLNNNKPGDCAISQTVQSKNKKERFVIFVVGHDTRAVDFIRLVIPRDSDLEPGVHLIADAQHIATVYMKRCDESGCFGELELGEVVNEQLRRSQSGAVLISVSGTEAYSLPLSMGNFGVGLDFVNAAIGKKHLHLAGGLRVYPVEATTKVGERDDPFCSEGLTVGARMNKGGRPISKRDIRALKKFQAKCGDGVTVKVDVPKMPSGFSSSTSDFARKHQWSIDQEYVAKNLIAQGVSTNIAVRDALANRDFWYSKPLPTRPIDRSPYRLQR